MITRNGFKVVIQNENRASKDVKSAEDWAKKACDRIFSHYSKLEMEEMRKKNAQ